MTMLFFIAFISGYFTIGVCAGSVTARVGYAFDKDVRSAEKDLSAKTKKYQELTAQLDALDKNSSERWSLKSTADRARSDVLNARQSAGETFSETQKDCRVVGAVVVFLWPLALAVSVVGGVGVLCYKIVARGLNYALTPGRYETHEALLKGEIQ